ncbi:glutamate racemase [Peptoclostridium litorale DSM 5388]|uniref:Glutamate racemase n=1 Tax=Peptoclostridium litorale DSM 5388 TaxID=1121324 RepID=A0A069RFD8_PEPLI|nr:glutamate racemase [Peptoclostridium litorale]KDR94915.1 glutamate racemase MurI [Peptoclostridium litorale DSM 5388]SIN95579.1 glutamate racemase [Peptoclostridium litorale DSM 5388]
MKNNPIGVFDSGIGGLTVLKEIMNVLPFEDIVYFGDTARVPYGSRSAQTVTKYAFQSINFLQTKGVKAIVIACNTATARSLSIVQEKYDIPIIGVINAGVKTALEVTKNKKVGVIGTEGTIGSKAYEIEMKKISNDITVVGKACPLFVPIAEEGWADTDVASLTAHKYLDDVKKSGIDSLVLGCTHYPLLANTIQKTVGSDVQLVNPARETAKDLKCILEKKGLLNEKETGPYYEYFVSDDPAKFTSVGQKFLNRDIEKINLVEIQKY